MSSTQEYARFNGGNWHSITRLVGKTFHVANYCFNCSGSKDISEVAVTVDKVELRKGAKGAFRLVLFVKAADDGSTYCLPDWTLFTSDKNVFQYGHEKAMFTTDFYEEGKKRNSLFSQACEKHGVCSATVLDGPAGNTAKSLSVSVKTIYQVNNDATTCIALGMMGYIPIFTKLVAARSAGNRKKVAGVYEMLWYAQNRPSHVKQVVLDASRTEAMALDIYGVWKPMYDDVLAGIAKEGHAKVLLLTYSVRNSYSHPRLPDFYRATSQGRRGLSRWLIAELENTTEIKQVFSKTHRRKALVYNITRMTEGTFALCASTNVDCPDEYRFCLSSESIPSCHVQVLCRNLKENKLLCRYLKPKVIVGKHVDYFKQDTFTVDENDPIVRWCDCSQLDVLFAWDSNSVDKKFAVPRRLKTHALSACKIYAKENSSDST
ncbi:hypothetical protein CYMTET_3010 [Cymbomonas tetramitiformis]|uniref:Uncharacterized protein n=1 Tax=Cymbomonas tetramitiformis TaxID=36881 RepID=A0AAE0H444_9CHLO|nr:hypothetical protein CYMTET_3010 [Cymbomonas tetramitiformis]